MSQHIPSPSKSPFPNSYQPQTSTVKPIPIIRSKLQYSSKLTQKLPIYGPKYISRIAASNEYTVNVLRKMKITTNLKLVHRFDFDSYFSKESGLRQLCQVLPRLRHNLKKLDLTIRKIERENETDILYPFIYRLERAVKIRIEFFNLDGLDQKGLTRIGQAFKKCYLMKELEVYLTHLPNIGHQGFHPFSAAINKLRQIEALTFHVRTAYDPSGKDEGDHMPLKKMKNLKSFDLMATCKTGWMSIKDRADVFLPYFFKSLPEILNPIKFSLSLNKLPLSVDALTELATALPKISGLRILTLELGNTGMQEFENLVLIKGLSNCKQIQHLILKTIE